MTVTADAPPRDRGSFRPLQVLDHQLDAIRYWQRSQNAPLFAKSFEPLVERFMGGQPLNEYLGDRLDTAETIFVKSHIITKLRTLARDFEDIPEPLNATDLPTDRGYVWLETPIYMKDARGENNSVKVIFWSKESRGVILVLFSDAFDRNDDISREQQGRFKDLSKMVSAGSRTPLCHAASFAWGQDIRSLTPKDFTVPPLLQADPEALAKHEKDLNQGAEDLIQVFRFILALWEFMGDQIPMVAYPDRPLRRRIMREKSTLSEVLVVDIRPLQNPSRHNEDPQLVMWSHRWRVRPHPRRYRNKETGEIIKVVQVKGCVKGPEHLPLIEKDRVYNVRR